MALTHPRSRMSASPELESSGEEGECAPLKRDAEGGAHDGRASPTLGEHVRRFSLQYALVAAALALIFATVLAACVSALAPSGGRGGTRAGSHDQDVWQVLGAAARSGVAGGASMVLNVLAFMWLRTTVNYQQAHVSVGAAQAIRSLYADGGVPRFYRGLPFALVQGPLCRFGDTAANAGVAALLPRPWFWSGERHALAVTVVAAALAACWRLLICPVDTLKTSLQVSGAEASQRLRRKAERHGPCVLWEGGYGGAAASAIGYLPWYFTYNLLDVRLPAAAGHVSYVLRHAVLGLCASVVSDVASNGARVVKVVKQTSAVQISYRSALGAVVRAEGSAGLCRGLGTKLVTNALQACVFTVVWRLLRDALA